MLSAQLTEKKRLIEIERGFRKGDKREREGEKERREMYTRRDAKNLFSKAMGPILKTLSNFQIKYFNYKD